MVSKKRALRFVKSHDTLLRRLVTMVLKEFNVTLVRKPTIIVDTLLYSRGNIEN